MELFAEVPCLTERSGSLKGTDLIKKYFRKGDKRVLAELLQRFISYNFELFSFLGVQPNIEGNGSESRLWFRSSCFIGAIPLRAPDTGKQIGDFVVAPRFVGRDRFQDYIEILDLLGSEISPEVLDSLPLVSGRNFRPPFYLEAVKFISSLENLVSHRWRKFDCLEKIKAEPAGPINWRKFATYEYDPLRRMKFPVRTNLLTEAHVEYAQIRYVFDICSLELMSPTTPHRVKSAFRNRLAFLEKRLYIHKPISTDLIAVRSSDSPTVQICKLQANRVLKRKLIDSTAWRVDFNDVFEKFVQHVFSRVAHSIGGKLHTNLRIPAQTSRLYSWELHHLEPDAVLQKGDRSISIDAKYKSNLFNKHESSELLKEDYRRDLHQVFAYSSFGRDANKIAAICYPSNEVETKITRFNSGISDVSNTLLLVGLPLDRHSIPDAVRVLTDRINFFIA